MFSTVNIDIVFPCDAISSCRDCAWSCCSESFVSSVDCRACASSFCSESFASSVDCRLSVDFCVANQLLSWLEFKSLIIPHPEFFQFS